MFSRLLGLLVVVAAVLISAQTAFAERRVALIIGNSIYKNVVQLPNPARDAASVADMFKKAGFDVVESKLNLNNTDMRRAIREFTATARNADIAVVYYAGHGIEFDGVNYLIPVDAQLATDVDVEDETVSLDRIIRMLDPVKRLRLVMLDACRENPFARKMTRTVATRSVGRGLAQVEVTGTDTLVAFAAKAGMTAADGDGDHSPFTTAVLDNLAIPGLDLRIAFGRVRDEVMKNTDRKQEPFVYGSIGGATVALVPKIEKLPETPAAKAATSNDTLARDYEFAERVGTKQAWDSFLAAHSTGFFADLARAARDKIISAEQRLTLGKEKAAEEELKRKAAEAARVKTIEEARLKAEAETKQRAAAEARANAEAKRLAEEENKLKAKLDATAKAQQAPIVVANAPNASPTSRSVAPDIDTADIARLLQFHLKRIGCDPGSLDGNWTDKSAHAMSEFNNRAKANFDVKVASIGALDAVKQHKDRLCPLVCGKGLKVEEDRCVAEACKRGFVRNKAGDCERETRAATRPRDEGGGGGQVFCSERGGGCQTVPKNCRVEHVTGGNTSGGTPGGGGTKVVCN
jgi:uncharacterized caspase-like protein